MLAMADEISKLPLNFVKIHNLHTVRHTELARQYASKSTHSLSEKM